MAQLHKRFTDDQVAFLLHSYSRGLLSRKEIQDTLKIRKTRFFELWKDYQADPEGFSIRYQRQATGRISAHAEQAIANELLRDKELIENPEIPISTYNYTALRDRLQKQGIRVSVNTILDRAKKLDCHIPRKKRKAHDREVLTSSVGALIQHDGSTHLWSPFASEKWTLITSIDDYSRMLLFADFVPAETTWAHIQAVRSVVETYGVPLRYYVDSLRVFRFVQGRDSFPGLSVQDRLAQTHPANRRCPDPMGQEDGRPGGRGHLCAFPTSQGQDRAALPLAAGSHRAHLRHGADR